MDEPLFKQSNNLEMTQELFDTLIGGIFDPSVVDEDFNGVTYMTYSQAVPVDNVEQDTDKI